MSFDVSVSFFSMRLKAIRRSEWVNHTIRVMLGESGIIEKANEFPEYCYAAAEFKLGLARMRGENSEAYLTMKSHCHPSLVSVVCSADRVILTSRPPAP